MKFSVSSLSFSGGKIKFMSDLPKNLGVEIFYEWGSENYWNGILPEIIEGRSGGFSIHGPMMFDDFSQPCDEDILFSHMRAPFELYHRYPAASRGRRYRPGCHRQSSIRRGFSGLSGARLCIRSSCHRCGGFDSAQHLGNYFPKGEGDPIS